MVRTSHVPIRTCLACGQKLPQRELVRIVRTLDGKVEIDFKGRKAGRGAYICSEAECWEKVLTKGDLDRALRTSVSFEAKQGLKAQYTERQELVVGKEAP